MKISIKSKISWTKWLVVLPLLASCSDDKGKKENANAANANAIRSNCVTSSNVTSTVTATSTGTSTGFGLTNLTNAQLVAAMVTSTDQANRYYKIDDPDFFDGNFYRQTYAGVAADNPAALTHWLTTGIFEAGKNPNADFDVDYYLANNADVAAHAANVPSEPARLTAIKHFLSHGYKEGRPTAPGKFSGRVADSSGVGGTSTLVNTGTGTTVSVQPSSGTAVATSFNPSGC